MKSYDGNTLFNVWKVKSQKSHTFLVAALTVEDACDIIVDHMMAQQFSPHDLVKVKGVVSQKEGIIKLNEVN